MSDASTTRNDRAFLCREAIAEMMGPIILGAEIVQRYAELGDEAGIHYQLKCMAAYFRSAGAAYRELAAVRNEALADESEGA
jgi:hypothetical protein